MTLLNKNTKTDFCKYPLRIFLFYIAIVINSNLFAQDLISLNNYSFIEEINIKTDRDLYIAGENVWLKILKLSGLSHTPVNLSKVVYLELLDIYNNPITQLKIGIDGSFGSASFTLPDTLSTGNYILRSYTSWMKNSSIDLFSYKRIAVINPFKDINNIKTPSSDAFPDSIIFTTEGGSMIAGINVHLGIKCIKRGGEPVAVNGALVYENNDTICSIRTEKNGYGWAKFTPSGVKGKLFLTTKNKNGTVIKFPLPQIQKEGISFSVINKKADTPLLVKIEKSDNFIPANTKLYLTLQSASLIYLKKELIIENNNPISLLQNEIPEGLSELKIIDENGDKYAERWIFNDPKPPLNFKININKNRFLPREKISIEITVTDNSGIPVESDLSISVVKSFTVNKNFINSHIYKQLPELANIAADTLSDINDYLLFYKSHDPIVNNIGEKNSLSAYIPELEGLLINGTITDRKSGEPLRNENITLSFVGKEALCQFTKTKEDGTFHFLTKEQGVHEMVIQPLSSEIKDSFVELNNPFVNTNNNNKNYDYGLFFIDSSRLADINKAIISMQIKKIYDPFAQPDETDAVSEVKPNFYGAPDNTILMSKYIELTSLKEVVKEIVPEVSTIKKNDEINFRLISRYQNQVFENNPLVLVDGIPINNLEKVLNINSKEIERIDILNTRYFISNAILDGILHFISKKGNLDVIDFDRNIFRLEYDLLQNRDKFYSPQYYSASQRDSHLPDFRNTLYWNPDLHTDKNGKSTAEFYSSDESDNYLIIIEGITSDGRTGISTMPLIIQNK